jgi:tetratricopeptide (TPR) repeat protein
LKKKQPYIASKERDRDKNKAFYSFYKKHIHLLAIFFLSTAIYLNTIPNDFNLDDELVSQNHILTSKGIVSLGAIFSQPYYKDAQGYSYDYRPMVLASFAIEHSLFGENPHISHTINVLLYGLMCVLLLACLSALFGNEYKLLSVVACLLFAVHPAHSEVVASLKNRDELLALMFSLMSLRFATKWIDEKKLSALILCFLFFVLGLLSKLSITSFAVLIPIGLVLLRSVSFTSIFVLSLLLVLPLIYLSNIPQLGYRLFFIAMVISTSLIFWLVKNSKIDTQKIKFFLCQVEKSAKDGILDFAVSFDSSRLFQFPNFILPFLLLLSSSVAFISFFSGMVLLMKVAILCLLAFWLVAIWEWKVLALPLIIGFGCLVTKQSGFISVILFDLLLAIFFIVGFMSRGIQRFLFIAFGLALLGMSIYNDFYDRIIVYVIFSLLLFLPVIPQKIRNILLLIGSLIAIVTSVKSISSNLLSLDFFILVVIATLVLRYKKQSLFYLLPLGVSFVLIVFVLFPNYVFPSHPFNPFSTLQNANTILAPSIIETANRPLNFLETPINWSTPWSIKIGTSMDILGRYVKLLFFPYPLSFYYGYSVIKESHILGIYPASILILHLFLAGIAFFYTNKKPIISFGLFVYLISILSFLPLVNSLPGMMADRYLLLPSIGFSILLAYVLLWTNQKTDQIGAIPAVSKVVLSTLLLLFCITTITRNFDWKDRLTLFENDIKHVEESGYAQNLLATHLSLKANQTTDSIKQKQLYEKACVHFQKSIAIYPDFLNSHFDLGRTYLKLDRNEEAIAQFKEAIRLEPSFSEPYINIAVLLDTKGELKEAATYYEKGLKINPNKLEVYANLSYVYYRQNDFASAINANLNAIEIYPSAYQPYINIGKVFYATQQKDSALYYFEKANQLNPNQADIINAIATLFAEKNDPKAKVYLEQLHRLQLTQ